MTVPYTPYLVANQRQATDLSMDSWLTPVDAYQSVKDAYLYRGVATKRNGYSWLDSMPYALRGTGGNPYQNISGITNGPFSVITTNGNLGVVVGQLIKLTDVGGFPASTIVNGTRWTVTAVGTNQFTINNTIAFIGTYTPTTGTVSKVPDGVNFIGNPIMAVAVWLDPTNVPNMIVLDTRRAAIYDNAQMTLKPIGYTDQFSGDSSNLFWWENYLGKIYFTNNIDTIFYWSGTQLATGLVVFTPNFTFGVPTDIVNTCLMIKVLNKRLCLYNTTEVGVSRPVRVRWCQGLIDPTTTGAWYDNTPGFGGNFDDLTGSLYIISQAQIQTNNLVMSQNEQFSVIYEQRNTSDVSLPFNFVKISTSRNINSTFGTIILDREVQMVGNTGLILTDGNTASRYDDKIPDFAQDIISQANFLNVFGIRNDRLWQTWTLFTSVDSPNGLNDKILVYNYQDHSFQFYNLSLSCAGLFPNQGSGPTWESYGVTLPDLTWEEFGEATWNSIPQASTTMLLGGDYSGNLWWMDQGGGDAADNIPFSGIPPVNPYPPPLFTNFLANGYSIKMELITRQWFPYAKEGMAAQFGYIDFLIDGDPTTVVGISFNVDNEEKEYLTSFFSCIPYENLDFSTINAILQPSNPTQISSIDHGLVDNQIVYIFAVQGMIELNGLSAAVTVIDDNTFTLNGVDNTAFSPYTSGGIVSQQDINQSEFWTRVNCGQTGVFHQMTIRAEGVNENFRLHAAMPWWKPTGRIYKG